MEEESWRQAVSYPTPCILQRLLTHVPCRRPPAPSAKTPSMLQTLSWINLEHLWNHQKVSQSSEQRRKRLYKGEHLVSRATSLR